MPNNYDRASLEAIGTFSVPISYSTLSLFDNIAHKNQVEVYRTNIESIYLAEFGQQANLSKKDKTRFGVIKPDWITYNETTKQITGITIPANQTFLKENGNTIIYPEMVSSEALEIRRRTINSEVLVEWITGSRFTAEQLNLLASQLIGICQENLFEIENKVLRTSDEDELYASVSYVDSEIAGVVGLLSLPGGIENATDYDKSLVVLSRISNQNIPQAAANFKWDEGNRKLRVIANASQTDNRLEFLASDGSTLVNFFNPRGVLNSAGRIFYGATAPTSPNALDTGILWWDTSGGNQILKVWGGSAWVALPTASGSFVTTNTSQTITGAKTFSAATTFSNTVSISSGNNLDYYDLGTNAKNLTATLADTQTITGVKTFNNHLVLGNSPTFSQPTIITSLGNTNNEGGSLILRINANTGTRYIQIYRNDLTTDGIVIRSLNPNGIGRLRLIGQTFQEVGDIVLNTGGSATRIRNINETRIPGSSFIVYKPANSDSLFGPAPGVSLPECTITYSINTSTKLQTFTITNTGTTEQQYKISVRLDANPTNLSASFNKYAVGSGLAGTDSYNRTITLSGGGLQTFTVGYTAQSPNFTIPPSLPYANAEIETIITVVK